MSTDTDLMKLYSKRILALAADMPYCERLENPDAQARKRSPLCGSTVSVDLNTAEGAISAFGQDVKACALGQAAAAIVGKNIMGMSHRDVIALRQELFAMLKENGPVPGAPFEEFEVLLPARDYKNRHASIMLALEAIDAAFTQASSELSSSQKDTA